MKTINRFVTALLALILCIVSVVPVYAVEKKDLEAAIITFEGNDNYYEYTSGAIIPVFSVKLDDTALIEGVDYVSDYTNNIEIGTATLTITAVAESNYIGTKSADFYIVEPEIEEEVKPVVAPKSPKLSAFYNDKNKSYVIVEYKKVSCDAYQIMYSTDSSFKTGAKSVIVKGKENTTKKIKVKNNNKKIYCRVRAINYNSENKPLYSSWSAKQNNMFNNLYSKYTSNYVNNKNRTTNLRIASKAIDGTVLAPGETFSFNKVVGKRTTAKGYKEAHVFNGPNETTMGTGGGVCQVASTIFNAVLLGNLKINERHQHSQRVTYVPLGRDAAIYWPSQDLKFTNNTDYPILIKMTVKDGKISCFFYTSQKVKPKKVKISVNRSGNNFTMRRSVGGKVNYTTKSHY